MIKETRKGEFLMVRRRDFFIHASDTEKNLYITRTENIKSDALSPCCMTPDDVDYEMGFGKDPEILEICGMNQKSLEYFVQHYGGTYRYLSFFKCQLIQDFSPLEDLQNLEAVSIYWNIRTDKLWNFSRNRSLQSICVSDAKRMTFFPDLLKTSDTLEEVIFWGSMFNNTPMDSLDCFSGMPNLQELSLGNIRLNDRRVDVLETLPALQSFHFDAGMFTTEEIAWMVAKYPQLQGKSLCAYNKEDAILNDVRVCGFRKPGLDLPKHQKRLDRYVEEFNKLVEQYRNT